MTRAEQIEKAVESYFAIDGRDVDIKPLGRAYFFAGAFWSDQNPPWRKYPDEKPTTKGDYLICTRDGEIVVDEFYIWDDPQDAWEEYYDRWWVEYDNDKVVAWMPLPQPPKFYTKDQDNEQDN